jgi:hypothetical protein
VGRLNQILAQGMAVGFKVGLEPFGVDIAAADATRMPDR